MCFEKHKDKTDKLRALMLERGGEAVFYKAVDYQNRRAWYDGVTLYKKSSTVRARNIGIITGGGVGRVNDKHLKRNAGIYVFLRWEEAQTFLPPDCSLVLKVSAHVDDLLAVSSDGAAARFKKVKVLT